MKDNRDQEIAPYVVAYFDFQGHEIYFIVENVGKSLANNVKIEFQPGLENSRGNGISKISLIKDGVSSIPPKYKIKTFFDMSPSYFEKKLPLKYKVKINYFGGLNDEIRTTEHILDIGAYKDVSFLGKKGLNELVREFEDLLKYNTEMSNNLKEIRKGLNEGIWVKNPEFLITSLELDLNSWFNVTKAILIQFKLLWNSIHLKEPEDFDPFIPDLQNKIRFIGTQILLISSKYPKSVTDGIIKELIEISSKIVELGDFTFYGDGGLSIRNFDKLGNDILELVDKILEEIKETDMT